MYAMASEVQSLDAIVVHARYRWDLPSSIIHTASHYLEERTGKPCQKPMIIYSLINVRIPVRQSIMLQVLSSEWYLRWKYWS